MLAVLFLNRMNMRKRATNKQQVKKALKTDQKSEVVEYCRTCLNTEDLVSIFYNKESEEKRTNDLRLVTGLEITMNDGLSQKICPPCIEIINTALQFRRTSRKAEKSLKNMLIGSKPKKKTKLQKTVKQAKRPKTKVEKVEFEEDYSYNYDDPVYADDFQNDYEDYLIKDEETKPKIKQKQLSGRKKRAVLPNAASYKCATCNKEFRMKATYKAHMRFHTNYCVCEACGKRCRNNNQLQEHKRARHGLGRIHKCAYCEYSSATKEALTIHERRHTGERPYICDHCGATFHRRSNLVQHMPIHLPEKNFQCPMCPKKLKSRKFLQIHVHNAHTGRRYGYLCPVCAHRFEKPNKVRAHMRRVHALPDEQHGNIARVQLYNCINVTILMLNTRCPRCNKMGKQDADSCPLCRTYEPYGRHSDAPLPFRWLYCEKCPMCPKREKSRKLLSIHEYKYHRENKYRYICPICQDSFTRPGNVRQHLARSHRVPREHQGVIDRLEINLPILTEDLQSSTAQYM